MAGALQILSNKSNEEYARKVYEELCLFPEFYARGYAELSPYCVPIKTFADGEIEAKLNITLRNNDIFLFSSSGRTPYEQEPAKSKLELYHTIDAIKRSSPARLVLFEPYCSPSRSDRTIGRTSVGLWLHFKILINSGVDHIISYQLHSDKSKTIVDPALCAIEDIPATLQLMEHIATHHIKTLDYFENYVKTNWLFCSVDAGGENFARDFAKSFQTGLITSFKQRDYTKVNAVTAVNILTATDITGKDIWIIDDMIDTGGSVETLIHSLAHHHVKSVNIAIVHPVFSDPALEKLKSLHKKGLLKQLLVLDTIPQKKDYEKKYPFITVVPSQRLSAQIVMRLHEQKSLSPFFEDFRIQNFLSQLSFRQ